MSKLDSAGVTGALLIGGKSQRFGTDKFRHKIGKSTFGERLLSELQHAIETVVVSGRKDQSNALPGHEFVPDAWEGEGPLAAVLSVFAATTSDWILFVACDMPGVTESAIVELLSFRTKDTRSIVPRGPDGRLHPLFSILHRSTESICRSSFDTGQRSLRHCIASIGDAGLVVYPTMAPAVLHNVNRIDELDRFNLTTQ
ncbi:MAG: molybdenum cofactor guanylyltransferase [Rhodothermales bacterium]|nr:molybdenum cofactor guanylyltransferase [Rhodothermales bacterium]